MAKGLTTYGTNNVSSVAQTQEKGFVTEISKAGNTGDFWADAGAKLTALPSAIANNPIGFGYTVVKEGIQEVIPILTGASAAKWGGKLIGFAANSIVNGVEAGGSGYNDTVAKAKLAGMNEDDAHAAGQKSFAASATVAAVLGPLVDAPFIKRAAGDVTQKVTLGTVVKSGAKEAPLEYAEEGSAQGFQDYFATGKVNVNNILTGGTVGAAVAGHTVASIQAGEVALDKAQQVASSQILDSVAGDKAGELQTQISNTIAGTKDLSDAGSQIATTMQDAGMNAEQAQSVANTAVAEAVVHNLTQIGGADTKFAIDDLNAPVGLDSNGNAVTVGDVLGSSVTGKGTDFQVQPDVVVGTGHDGRRQGLQFSTCIRPEVSGVSGFRDLRDKPFFLILGYGGNVVCTISCQPLCHTREQTIFTNNPSGFECPFEGRCLFAQSPRYRAGNVFEDRRNGAVGLFCRQFGGSILCGKPCGFGC